MFKSKDYKSSLFIVLIIVLILSIYVLFDKMISNKKVEQIEEIKEIKLIDDELNVNDFEAGSEIIKKLRVENSSDNDYEYRIEWGEVENGFSNQADLKYSVSCLSYSDYEDKTISSECNGTDEYLISPKSKKYNDKQDNIITLGNVIKPSHTQEYIITFKVDENISPTTIMSFNSSYKLVKGLLKK